MVTYCCQLLYSMICSTIDQCIYHSIIHSLSYIILSRLLHVYDLSIGSHTSRDYIMESKQTYNINMLRLIRKIEYCLSLVHLLNGPLFQSHFGRR